MIRRSLKPQQLTVLREFLSHCAKGIYVKTGRLLWSKETDMRNGEIEVVTGGKTAHLRERRYEKDKLKIFFECFIQYWTTYIFEEATSNFLLLLSSCYSKISYTRWVIKNRKVFLFFYYSFIILFFFFLI